MIDPRKPKRHEIGSEYAYLAASGQLLIVVVTGHPIEGRPTFASFATWRADRSRCGGEPLPDW